MTPAFQKALARTLTFEGGLSDHPDDRGGRTLWGVTQSTYDKWRSLRDLPHRPVDDMEDGEMRAIYFDFYWVESGCEFLPDDLACAVFDMAVNSGPWNAKLTLQRAVRVRTDGVVGPVTVKAAKATPDAVLLFLKKRAAFIQDVISMRPSQIAFLEGWINRLLDQAWRPS